MLSSQFCRYPCMRGVLLTSKVGTLQEDTSRNYALVCTASKRGMERGKSTPFQSCELVFIACCTASSSPISFQTYVTMSILEQHFSQEVFPNRCIYSTKGFGQWLLLSRLHDLRSFRFFPQTETIATWSKAAAAPGARDCGPMLLEALLRPVCFNPGFYTAGRPEGILAV